MKKILSYLIFLLITTISGFIICIALFHTRLFAEQHVLMYRGIALIVLSTIILAIIIILVNKKIKTYDVKDIISAIIVFLCIKMTFFVLVPVTVERSVSVFTLSQIAKSDKATITKAQAEQLFIEKYVDKNDAFGKRFDEQIVTGSIKKNPDGSFTLTDRGHMLVEMFEMIGYIYNADMKNMIDE